MMSCLVVAASSSPLGTRVIFGVLGVGKTSSFLSPSVPIAQSLNSAGIYGSFARRNYYYPFDEFRPVQEFSTEWLTPQQAWTNTLCYGAAMIVVGAYLSDMGIDSLLYAKKLPKKYAPEGKAVKLSLSVPVALFGCGALAMVLSKLKDGYDVADLATGELVNFSVLLAGGAS